jgi:hypothetical protein
LVSELVVNRLICLLTAASSKNNSNSLRGLGLGVCRGICSGFNECNHWFNLAEKHDVAVRVEVLVGILCCCPGIYAAVDSGLNE